MPVMVTKRLVLHCGIFGKFDVHCPMYSMTLTITLRLFGTVVKSFYCFGSPVFVITDYCVVERSLFPIVTLVS